LGVWSARPARGATLLRQTTSQTELNGPDLAKPWPSRLALVGKAGLPGEHNVPVPLSSFVGRVRELDGIGETLRRTRLVTLTGPGGVGKTRLALEVARRQVGRPARGVWLVDFAAVPERPDVAAETARVLGVSGLAGTTATDRLRTYLADRDVLLVFDNCEHVVDDCARLAATLLSSCGDLRVLATSREVLGVSGETVWRVEPLQPEDARRLFIERARLRRPEFIPNETAEADIDRLCARLDRLPLAIELAAARVGVMSIPEILSGVKEHLGELAGGDRLSPPHHWTVRAAVEWSHQLLESHEQEALHGLAVFVGGFDAYAATSVAPGLSMDMLARLADKSLVTVAESPSGRTRYRLLETVREFALERLAEAGELESANGRHVRYFSRFADADHDGWPSPGALRLVNQLHDDYENVRAAVEWAAALDPCEARVLLAGVGDLFLMLAPGDGVRLAQTLLERCPRRDRDRAELQIMTGITALAGAFELQTANKALAEAGELSQELGERRLQGWAQFYEGLAKALTGATAPARERLEASRALHHELGILHGWARATAVLGLTYLTDDPTRGRDLLEEALAVNVDLDDDFGQGQCHLYLGMIAEVEGDRGRQASHFRQAVEHMAPYQGGPLLPVALAGQAGVLVRRDPSRALRVAAAAYALRERQPDAFAPAFRGMVERARAAALAAVGADAERIWKDGFRLPLDEAIALALGTGGPRQRAPAGLSEREMEVARLVAGGLSNKAIGASLHLSVRTVESHVRNALAKAGVENRTQLATWARERIQ